MEVSIEIEPWQELGSMNSFEDFDALLDEADRKGLRGRAGLYLFEAVYGPHFRRDWVYVGEAGNVRTRLGEHRSLPKAGDKPRGQGPRIRDWLNKTGHRVFVSYQVEHVTVHTSDSPIGFHGDEPHYEKHSLDDLGVRLLAESAALLTIEHQAYLDGGRIANKLGVREGTKRRNPVEKPGHDEAFDLIVFPSDAELQQRDESGNSE